VNDRQTSNSGPEVVVLRGVTWPILALAGLASLVGGCKALTNDHRSIGAALVLGACCWLWASWQRAADLAEVTPTQIRARSAVINMADVMSIHVARRWRFGDIIQVVLRDGSVRRLSVGTLAPQGATEAAEQLWALVAETSRPALAD
jgi:hypothetical protein